MKVGEVNAVQMSYFTSMLEVVKAAFGSSDKKGNKPITEDMSKMSAEDFASKLNRMGRRKE